MTKNIEISSKFTVGDIVIFNPIDHKEHLLGYDFNLSDTDIGVIKEVRFYENSCIYDPRLQYFIYDIQSRDNAIYVDVHENYVLHKVSPEELSKFIELSIVLKEAVTVEENKKSRKGRKKK